MFYFLVMFHYHDVAGFTPTAWACNNTYAQIKLLQQRYILTPPLRLDTSHVGESHGSSDFDGTVLNEAQCVITDYKWMQENVSNESLRD